MKLLDRTLLDARLPLAVGFIASLFVGCATVPPAPTSNIQAAQQAIANAERVEAGRYAAGDLTRSTYPTRISRHGGE